MHAKVTNNQRAYELILDAIFKGELKAGAAVTEEWVGGHLNMSRTPVREALIRLQADGIITETNNRSTVTIITPVDIKEIFELRLLLEPYAASLCIGLINKDAMLEIRKHTQAFMEKPDNNDLRNPYDIHRLILESTRNRRLITISNNLQAQIRRIIVTGWRIPGRSKRSLEEHMLLTDAILEDDRVMAEMYMRQHLRSFMNDMLDPGNYHLIFRE